MSRGDSDDLRRQAFHNSRSKSSNIDQRLSFSTPPSSPESNRERQRSTALAPSYTPDTPSRSTSHGSDRGYPTVKAMTPILEEELKDSIQMADEEYFQRVVVGRVHSSVRGTSESSVKAFVDQHPQYDCKRKSWKGVYERPEAKLYNRFCELFESVIDDFKIEDRAVIDTHKTEVHHREGSEKPGNTGVKTSPDLFVFGKRPNFHSENIDPSPQANYTFCASPCEVKTEKNLKEGIVTQVGVYARYVAAIMTRLLSLKLLSSQCFIQQGSRKYVYSLVMTERQAFLLQFDRNDVFRSLPVDIHKEPVKFIYLILLVCSPDPSVPGFDTNIYWRGDKRYIETFDIDGTDTRARIEYEILRADGRPFIFRRNIHGRGTVCWKVKDPTGKVRIIKDSWQADGRALEKDLLKKVQGLKGVGQMVACEDDRPSIEVLRGMEGHKLPDGISDRFPRRLVLEAYGNTIDNFTSRTQFLCAFRDAVAGHQNMWNKNILHRDISINNILIGEDGADDGDRGVVIDLDMAVELPCLASLAGVDFRTASVESLMLLTLLTNLFLQGTKAFQSIAVIASAELEQRSFFYVFCWICMGYTATGLPLNPPPDIHIRWETLDEPNLVVSKEHFILVPHGRGSETDEVVQNFGQLFQDVLDAYRSFLAPHISRKSKRDLKPQTLEQLQTSSKTDYAIVLAILDAAIVKLKEEEAEEENEKRERLQAFILGRRPSPVSSPPRGSLSPSEGRSSSLKRKASIEFRVKEDFYRKQISTTDTIAPKAARREKGAYTQSPSTKGQVEIKLQTYEKRRASAEEDYDAVLKILNEGIEKLHVEEGKKGRLVTERIPFAVHQIPHTPQAQGRSSMKHNRDDREDGDVDDDVPRQGGLELGQG
ncbi:hypothetical protein NLJ89_g2549 [Agrocybe chaxingu]|uniref:Fungal-type protein kinase domain-containing protein n=1 Tax=Agrocybe chaxingu TaxID=84603 RepID=A0A9W8KC55_9AGAR|nr:hypothetical protein NLJ89_g2549 [Agrocybe chaxingu]